MREGALLLADGAYDTNALRDSANEKRAGANILSEPNCKASFPFSAWVYPQRNQIERFFNKLKQFRGIKPGMTKIRVTFSFPRASRDKHLG